MIPKHIGNFQTNYPELYKDLVKIHFNRDKIEYWGGASFYSNGNTHKKKKYIDCYSTKELKPTSFNRLQEL